MLGCLVGPVQLGFPGRTRVFLRSREKHDATDGVTRLMDIIKGIICGLKELLNLRTCFENLIHSTKRVHAFTGDLTISTTSSSKLRRESKRAAL